MHALILAAGRGTRLRDMWAGPKCLVPVGGVPLLRRYLAALRRAGVRELHVVTGHDAERIEAALAAWRDGVVVRTIYNPRYARGSVWSLDAARALLTGDVLLMDGDVLFEDEVLLRLLRSPGEALAVDPSSPHTDEAYMAALDADTVVAMGRGLRAPRAGEWVGFARLSAARAERLASLVATATRDGGTEAYEDLLCAALGAAPWPWVSVAGLRWVEIDTPEDLRRARRLAEVTVQ